MPTRRTRGRPRVNPLPRRQQLLVAKRRQRRRERAQGLRSVEVKLPAPYAELLRHLKDDEKFRGALQALLHRSARKLQRGLAQSDSIRLADYPQLRLLAWSRDPDLSVIAPDEAFALYEANWRFVDATRLSEREHALIKVLAQRFGSGVLNIRESWQAHG